MVVDEMEHSEAGLPRIDWQSQASTHTEKKNPPVDQGEPDRPASPTPYSQSLSVAMVPDRSGRRVGGRLSLATCRSSTDVFATLCAEGICW